MIRPDDSDIDEDGAKPVVFNEETMAVTHSPLRRGASNEDIFGDSQAA